MRQLSRSSFFLPVHAKGLARSVASIRLLIRCAHTKAPSPSAEKERGRGTLTSSSSPKGQHIYNSMRALPHQRAQQPLPLARGHRRQPHREAVHRSRDWVPHATQQRGRVPDAERVTKDNLETCTERISSEDIDASAVAAAQAYLRKHLPSDAHRVNEVPGHIKGTKLNTISITFRVGNADEAGQGVTVVTAKGISQRRKTAVTLCYMHVSRLLEYHTRTLPAWRANPEGKENARPPAPPLPLREESTALTKNAATRGSRAQAQANAFGSGHGQRRRAFPARSPPQPTDFVDWRHYTRAAKEYVLARRAASQEAAFLQLRLPSSGNDLVDCAAAVVERHAPTGFSAEEKRRKTLTNAERNAKQALGGLLPPAGKLMQTVRVHPHVHVTRLVLDPQTNVVATGVGRKRNIAEARCAMHALCIMNLTKMDSDSIHQHSRETKNAASTTTGREADSPRSRGQAKDDRLLSCTDASVVDQRKMDVTARFLQVVLRTAKPDTNGAMNSELYADAGESEAMSDQHNDGKLRNSTLPSAPLAVLLNSLPPRVAKLYKFFTLLFEKDLDRPKVVFSWDTTSRTYTCSLTLSDITCQGVGINRFEAERSALETAMNQLSMLDERLPAIEGFIEAFPKIAPEGIPLADLPPPLRASLSDGVQAIRSKLRLDKPEKESAFDNVFTDERNSDREETVRAGNSTLSERAEEVEVGGAALDGTENPPSDYAVHMQEKLTALRENPRYLANYHPRRSSLAMARVEEALVRTVANNRVTIICGTTGCGKTTQVPQYILDDEIRSGRGDACRILVTQPRRLTAFGVSERIAQERLSRVGEDVGYVVRLDAKPGKHITLCTSGVLVQMLSGSPNLDKVSHLILDEVHERDLNCDVILSLGKQLLERNPKIKMIIMSATMQVGLFEKYFHNPPTISVDGAVYPVREVYLEDIAAFAQEPEPSPQGGALPQFYSPMFDAAEQQARGAKQRSGGLRTGGWGGRSATTAPMKTDYQLIAYLVHRSAATDLQGQTAGKSILVFLPGWKEIQAAKQAIEAFSHSSWYRQKGSAGPAPRFHFILLHSTVNSVQQRECFLPAPDGLIKVVLATNIAESGITIDDAAVVIDTGLIKLTSWVPTGRRVGQQRDGSTYQAISEEENGDADGAPPAVSEAERQMYENQATSFSTQLALCYASRANGTQRKGRAGRTQGGVCYRLFTRATWENLPAHQTAEIHRVPLTQVLLKLLSMGHLDPRRTLRTFIEPPTAQNVEVSMMQLKHLDAVSASEALTPLGRYLAMLPCDPRIGKMIMLGAVLHCMDSILTVAATADANPFVLSRDCVEEKRKKLFMFSRGSQSDHISFLNAYNAFCFNRENREFAHFNYLNVQSLSIISKYKLQYLDILRDSGLISVNELTTAKRRAGITADRGSCSRSSEGSSSSTSCALDDDSNSKTSAQTPLRYEGDLCVDVSPLSEDAGDVSLVKACICAALFPNVAVLDSIEATTALTAATGGSEMGNHMRQHKSLSKKVKLRTKTMESISPATDSACRRIGGPRVGRTSAQRGADSTHTTAATDLLRSLTGPSPSTLAHAPADPQALTTPTSSDPRFPAMYYVYQDIFSVRESRTSFLTNVTSVSLWALLLFGASDANTRYYDDLGLCVMDGWLAVRIAPESFHALTALKQTLHACVWRKYRDPTQTENNAAMDALRHLCKEVLKAPLDQQGATRNRLVDSGGIINPMNLEERAHLAGGSAHEAPSTASQSLGSSGSEDLGRDLSERERRYVFENSEEDEEEIAFDEEDVDTDSEDKMLF